MNPSSSDSGNSQTGAEPDSLTQAQNDATENFWYGNVGGAVAGCGSVPAPTVVSQDKKHWIEIALLDENGNPVPDQEYTIKLPSGETVTGTLNSKGRARVEGIDAGTCRVTFQNLDQHSWKPR